MEVIIIGGGPAGMNAALVLGRSRIKTLVLNTENARNLVTTHSHGFLTQDGKHPSEIFAEAKKQLEKYPSVSYKKEKAITLDKISSGFSVKTDSGKYKAKRVILATGYKDNIDLVGIPGLSEVYGKSVYVCPFCDGFEMADKKLAVFGNAFMAPMFSKIISHWSEDIIVFTNGEQVEDKDLVDQLNSKGISIIEAPIQELISEGGQLKQVVLEDDNIIEREGGFMTDTKATESVDFAQKLKIPTEEGRFGQEMYIVDDHKETNVEGFYIVGDARSGWSGVVESAAEGATVAKMITHQIIAENWK
jgi:thioredoxin reductase